MQGMFAHNGNTAAGRHRQASRRSRSRGITDGTSNTIMYGEHAHSRISQGDADEMYGINWWTSGDYGDTTFSTMFPPNFFDQRESAPTASARRCSAGRTTGR